jgi:hypothetical protein
MKNSKLLIGLIVIFLLLYFNQKSSAQVKVGDTLKFWSVAYIDWYPTHPPYPPVQYHITAVCKKVGSSCYLFFDTAYSHNLQQTNLDDVAYAFDNLLFPTLTALYGANPTGIDGDPKIYILSGSGDGMWAGYFDPLQGMPDTMTWRLWGKNSSQKEIIYVAGNYWKRQDVISHEFGHLLHWGQDHSPEPPEHPIKYWEESWVDEGFSTFAQYCFGDTFSLPDRMFNYMSSPGNYSLIWFESYDPSRLIFSYCYEQFGGDLFLKTLISEQANGFEGFRKTLKKLGYSISFDDLFENLALACYADDRFFENNKYGFYHYNFQSLPVLFQTLMQHSAFPINNQTGEVRPYSAKYVDFSTSNPMPLKIEFDGEDSSKFRLTFMFYNNTQLLDVRKVNLDIQNNARFIADSFGIAYNRIAMAVINVDSSLGFSETGSFTYSASQYSAGIYDENNNFFNIYPNPSSGYIIIKTNQQRSLNNNFEMIDQFGKTIFSRVLSNSETELDISALPTAIYFIKFNTDDQIFVRKFIKY